MAAPKLDDYRVSLAGMFHDGSEDDEIASTLGVAEKTVRNWRAKLGLRRAPYRAPTPDAHQRAEVRRLRNAGMGRDRIAKALGLPEGSVRAAIEDVEEVGDAEVRRDVSREAAFVARLLADGGMPRAVVVDGRTLWLGADNRPWVGPSRRRIAA